MAPEALSNAWEAPLFWSQKTKLVLRMTAFWSWSQYVPAFRLTLGIEKLSESMSRPIPFTKRSVWVVAAAVPDAMSCS